MTWLAIFAILLASLAPSISHAIAAARLADARVAGHDAVGEESLCHVETAMATPDHSGHVTGHAAPSSSHSHSNPSLHFEHCPFCFTHAGSFGLMPVTIQAIPAIAGMHILPSLFYQSPAPLFVWINAQPRAPPALS